MELEGRSMALLLANPFEDAEATFRSDRLQEAVARGCIDVLAGAHARA
jgi:hypothetical protein